MDFTNGAGIGIGIGVGVVVLALLGLVGFYIYLKRRRQRRAREAAAFTRNLQHGQTYFKPELEDNGRRPQVVEVQEMEDRNKWNQGSGGVQELDAVPVVELPGVPFPQKPSHNAARMSKTTER